MPDYMFFVVYWYGIGCCYLLTEGKNEHMLIEIHLSIWLGIMVVVFLYYYCAG